MSRIFFKVERQFCGDCSLAVRRFIGRINGVRAVDVESGKVSVEFDDGQIVKEEIGRLTRECIGRLGYRAEED